jgi:hypothetical protein
LHFSVSFFTAACPWLRKGFATRKAGKP